MPKRIHVIEIVEFKPAFSSADEFVAGREGGQWRQVRYSDETPKAKVTKLYSDTGELLFEIVEDPTTVTTSRRFIKGMEVEVDTLRMKASDYDREIRNLKDELRITKESNAAYGVQLKAAEEALEFAQNCLVIVSRMKRLGWRQGKRIEGFIEKLKAKHRLTF